MADDRGSRQLSGEVSGEAVVQKPLNHPDMPDMPDMPGGERLGLRQRRGLV